MKAYLFATLLAACCAFAVVPARADEGPTFEGPLSPAESQFLASVKSDLTARFPHATDAEKAGYVRYTAPDDTGAISYANQQWTSDPTHPSQLWYDKNGNLLGADFSVPRPNGEPRPQLWGINPGRWVEFNGHVHYVVKDPTSGKTTYDLWIWNNDFVAAGGARQPERRNRCKTWKSAERQLRHDDFRVSNDLGSDRMGDAARSRAVPLVDELWLRHRLFDNELTRADDLTRHRAADDDARAVADRQISTHDTVNDHSRALAGSELPANVALHDDAGRVAGRYVTRHVVPNHGGADRRQSPEHRASDNGRASRLHNKIRLDIAPGLKSLTGCHPHFVHSTNPPSDSYAAGGAIVSSHFTVVTGVVHQSM